MTKREKSVKKRRNILRNNTKLENKYVMSRHFFPSVAAARYIVPWWIKMT